MYHKFELAWPFTGAGFQSRAGERFQTALDGVFITFPATLTPEDLVVLSFPGPDRSISLDQLRSGRAATRRYRSRRTGEFLKELDLTKGRATGVPKILRALLSPQTLFFLHGFPMPRGR